MHKHVDRPDAEVPGAGHDTLAQRLREAAARCRDPRLSRWLRKLLCGGQPVHPTDAQGSGSRGTERPNVEPGSLTDPANTQRVADLSVRQALTTEGQPHG